MLVYHFEGVPRNPLVVAIKNVLTLGIHTKVWLYRVNRELDGREGFHINLVWLALMLWLPIVTPAIVKFQTAGRLNQMVSDPVTIPLIRARTLGWISLVPVLGAGFYAYWVQSSLNKFWFWNRRKERYQLNVERIKQIAQAPESEKNLQRRFLLEEECRRIEREMEEEIQAVRLNWGEEKFMERKKRADLHAKRGRLSRKQVHELRKKQKAQRIRQRERRRRERSLIARYRPRRADPEKDELWQPYTPLPERMPDEILAAAKNEGREPTRKESKAVKRAERLLAAREKEAGRLQKRRAKLLARLRRKEARLEARAQKKGKAVDAKGRKDRKARKKDRRKGAELERDGGRKPAGGPERGLRRRYGVLPPRRDPDVDAHWEPTKPIPEREPEEILAAAEQEGRAPTKKELKQANRAEAMLEKREKEEERLQAAREKARTQVAKKEESDRVKSEKAQDRLAAKEERAKKRDDKKQAKRDGKKRAKADKPEKKKSGKPPKKQVALTKRTKKAKQTKKAQKPEKPERPEKADKPLTGSDDAGASSSPVKLLQVRCPQCKSEVPVKKRDDRPARLQCPSCGLVGKV